MFELVEQQPSHLACPDVLNLSVGESKALATSQVGTGHHLLHCWGGAQCGLCDASVPSVSHQVPF